MKKYFLMIMFIFIILQLSVIFVDQYFKYLHKKTTIYNLTSLMTPFKQMNQRSTFGCSEMTLQDRYKLEFHQLERYHLHQSYKQPTKSSHYKQYMTSALPELPYFYSLWKTSSLLPRLMTPCEHQLYIKLLKTFDQICQKNDIEYMISHGTLLGSYRNHDILPYDDDVDIMVHVKYYSHLSEINRSDNKTDWKFYLNTPENMKFYFRSSPSAGSYSWKWPFIGIQFYTDNSTHIKLKSYIKKDIIFPLILRPVATLWLPGPRRVHMFLDGLRKYYYSKLSIDDHCLSQSYSHRNEKQEYKQRTVNCTELYNIYPYIRRICDDNNYCDEYFMLNNMTTLYVLKINNNELIETTPEK